MKRGTKVAVCYDGKYGRRVQGIVTETRNGHHIKVRFVPYAANNEVEVDAWFRINRSKWKGQRKYFGGWARYENALMPMLFPMFGATAPGDYYTVHKWPNAPSMRRASETQQQGESADRARLDAPVGRGKD